MADEAVVHGDLIHLAFFYHDQAEYLTCIQAFAHDGLAHAEPLFVAVPGDKARLVRTQLGEDYGEVSYGDMAELGRNPGRIIPAIRAFAEDHPGQRVRYICEPVWPARSAPETCEAVRHEALINLAFSSTPVSIMCPYDAASLTPAALLDARFTHPAVLKDGQPLDSADFAGPGLLPPECDRPLSAPPSYSQALGYRTGLRPLRALVTAHASSVGLSPERAADLVLAVSEIAANTLRHTSGDGQLWVWHTEEEIICQVQDHGWITDPLAGQRRRPADEPGHGLWVVHQVCDLVEVRTGEVRMWHAQWAGWRGQGQQSAPRRAAGTARTPPGSPG